jgi:hypothetical protein
MTRILRLLLLLTSFAVLAASCELEAAGGDPDQGPWGVERRVDDRPEHDGADPKSDDESNWHEHTYSHDHAAGKLDHDHDHDHDDSSSTTTLPETTVPVTTLPETTVPVTTSPVTTLPETTVPVTTVTEPPTTTAPPSPTSTLPATGETLFFEDFVSNDAISRFDTGIYHRDDSVVASESWLGDHAPTGADDACSSPFEKRTIERGNRSEGFNNDWIYRCAPGGDTAKAHLMTSIGDTSGYSLGGFSPTQVFTNVREVRWDVNQTDLGDRQWTEIAIIPADRFDFANLPCTGDVPCDTTTHPELGSVGTQWSAQFARKINTPASPNGYLQAGGDLGYRCDTCPYAPSASFGEAYGQGDSALTSFVIRRTNFFRDNGDGTLTWGFQLEDGSFNEFTAPGAFPSGPVRVVFKDHNYTPMKSPATLLPETTFTWHWDNIGVYG